MKTLNATEQQVLTAIRNTVAAVSPSYIYNTNESNGAVNKNADNSPACSYLNYTGPRDEQDIPVEASCLIGHGVIDSGLMTPEVAIDWEGFGANDILANVRNGGEYLSPDFIGAMCDIQGAQDTFKPWKFSFEYGLDSLSNYGYDVSSYRL